MAKLGEIAQHGRDVVGFLWQHKGYSTLLLLAACNGQVPSNETPVVPTVITPVPVLVTTETATPFIPTVATPADTSTPLSITALPEYATAQASTRTPTLSPIPTIEPLPTATEAAPVVDAIMNPGVVGEMQPIDVQGLYTGGMEVKPEYRAQAHQETKEAIVLSVENREYILQLLGLNSGSTEQAILSSMDTYLSEHNYQFPLVLQKEDGTEMVYKFLQGEVGPYANFPDNDDVNYINQMKSLGYINLDRSFFMSIDSSEFASNYHGIRDFFNNRPFKSVLFDATTPENSWRMMGLTLTDDHRLIQVVGTTTTQPKPDLPSWPRGNLIKHSNIDVNIQGKLATEWFDLYLYILRGSTDFDIDPALGNNNFKRKVIHAFRDYGETGIGFVSSEANNFQLIQD